MKNWVFAVWLVCAIASCKKDSKEILENEKGQQLSINDKGDTILIDKDTIKTSDASKNISALQPNDDGTYTFKYNLKQGETYPFLLKISLQQSMTDGQNSMKLNSSRSTELSYFVEKVENGKFHLKATFKNFDENFTSPEGEKLAYDTRKAKPKDVDVAKSWSIYKAITGESFQMVVDDKGKVLSVLGLDKIIASVQGKLKKDFTTEEQNMIKELLSNALSQDFIKSQFEETLNIFPDKHIKIGEKWTDNQNISEGPIKGSNEVTRTFKEITGDKATITVSGIQDVKGNDTQNGIAMNMTNHSTINGNVNLDTASGWITKATITKKETVKTTYSKDGQNQSATQTSTTTTTVN